MEVESRHCDDRFDRAMPRAMCSVMLACVCGRARLGVVRFAVCLVFLVASVAGKASNHIYVSYQSSSKQLPIYTDQPLNPTSRIIASVDDRLQRRTFTSIPLAAAPNLRRSAPLLSQRTAAGSLAARRDAIEPLVQHAARTHGVEAALLKAVIEVESGFHAEARSPKGASGLMQIMPATAARYGQFNLFSPQQNIDVGTRYLRDLLALFGGNVRLAVAAYNAGEQAVIRHGRQVPSYPETRRYVPMVMERYNRYLPRARSGTETAVAYIDG